MTSKRSRLCVCLLVSKLWFLRGRRIARGNGLVDVRDIEGRVNVQAQAKSIRLVGGRGGQNGALGLRARDLARDSGFLFAAHFVGGIVERLKDC